MKHTKTIFLKNCAIEMELPYHYPKICVYYGATGTSRKLDNSPEYYQTCLDCMHKPVVQRKRNVVSESDLDENKKEIII